MTLFIRKSCQYGAFAIVALLASQANAGPPEAKKPSDKEYDGRVRPILERHCLSCHGMEKTKGNLPSISWPRISPTRGIGSIGRTRSKRVQAGEMPPEKSPRPPEKDVKALTEWIAGKIQAADALRRTQGRVVLRRLNRNEYENTVRDLLGVQVDLKEQLPEDSSAGGFDNVGEALHLSSFLMERYLEAAEKALNVAIANGPKPPPSQKKRYSMKDCRVRSRWPWKRFFSSWTTPSFASRQSPGSR